MRALENGGKIDFEGAEPKLAIPAARPLSDFSYEEVGDDLVLFDAETLQYHTLNATARAIWQSCDGIATVETIAASTGLPIDATIAELAEASLLYSSTRMRTMSINRRRAAKMVAGGIVGLPVVLSITAPHASAQMSPITCVTNSPCEGYAPGTPCTYNAWPHVCCYEPAPASRSAWIVDGQVTYYVSIGWNCGQP